MTNDTAVGVPGGEAGRPREIPARGRWQILRRAWAEARPDKVVPTSGEELRQRWVEELQELGYRRAGVAGAPSRGAGDVAVLRPGELDRIGLVDVALVRLGARRSAWNPADARGEVERLLAATGAVIDGAVRRELAEDLTARVVAASRPLLGRADVPEHVRALTSTDVLAVEHEIVDRITRRAESKGIKIVEGAAGAGKTTRLAATRKAFEEAGYRMLVVTPTRKAAQVAAHEVGATAHSAAWLLHQHGFRWDEDGRWSRVQSAP